MNLFFKSYRNLFIFFLLITWEPGFNRGMAQGIITYPTPWIQEIEIPDHYADIGNESFFLDRLGHLFIGKLNGVTIVNENRSVHLYMDGPVFISGNRTDTLFYTCRDDMGYLLINPNGSFYPRSFKERIPRVFRDFIPAQLIYLHGMAFLNANQGIYCFNKDHVEIFPYPDEETRLYLFENRLLLLVDRTELLEWNGEGFGEPANQIFSGAISGQVKGFITGKTDYTFIDFINNKEIMLISPREGILLTDLQGRRKGVLGWKTGLPGRDIRQVIAGDGEELWILGSHTLHKVNYPSALEILEVDGDVAGRILASTVSDHQIVLGTSEGVYTLESPDTCRVKWIIREVTKDFPGVFHLLDRTGDLVFAAGSGQLIVLQAGEAKVLSTGIFTGIYALDTDLLVASGEKGLNYYKEDKGIWNETAIDPSLANAYSFSSFNDRIFFICGNSAFTLSDDLTKAVPVPFHRDNQLYSLVSMDGFLYLITDTQVYRYDESEETFLPLEKDNKARMLTDSDIVIPDESEGYWIVRHQGKYRSRIVRVRETFDPAEADDLYPILQHLGEIIDINISDSVLYLTGINKVAMFYLRAIKPLSGSTHLRIEPSRIPDSGSEAEFYLSGLEFQSSPEPEFRYMLDPDQKHWSVWNTNRTIHFNRLKPGDYLLTAQARDLFGRDSEPASYRFTVKAPFYRAWYAYTFYVLILLIILFLVQKMRLLSYQRAESRVSQRMQTKFDDLAEEKERSDKLMAEILPEKTVAQIKSTGKAKWDKYDRVTVLFSDIQGFTRIAEEMNPEALIDELDKFFFHFDSVVERYNIEKIKTIGDAYMAAGGIPEKNSTNPVEVVLAALEMQTYMQHLKSTKAKIWDLRIGIHTGPVIAGVVGHKKISYDIWGDTVNTASRMESSGMPGKVNISGITYGMVKEYFICEYRGRLPVKYKGNIDMYFVNGLRPELAVDLKGIPNKRFFTKLQLLRLGDLEEKVFGSILAELPENLHFHRLEYAQKVYNQTFLLCRAEEVEQEDRLLVRTAALMLFTGITQSFQNFENRSSVLVRELLPEFKYSEIQIDMICNLIIATKQPFHPNNLLEKILIDAKMEYIGRPDYPTLIKLQYQELVESGIHINGQQFKKQQLELLYEFDFFTVAARRLREVSGEEQMATLEQERWI